MTDPSSNPAPSELLVPDEVERAGDGAGAARGVGRVAGQGDADRLDDQAAARRGPPAELDQPSRERLREIYETSVAELASALSPDLSDELGRLALPFDEDVPSEAELRIAQAQLVGWLEGLFHGIQTTLFAQQMAARQQLEEMRRRLPPGQQPPDDGHPGVGTYL
jgi:hypothetical protein